MTHPDYYNRKFGGYRVTADDIRKRIEAGEWTVHLPGIPELSDMYDVAYQTARNAVKHLETHGLVVVEHGKITVIVSGDEPTITEAIQRVTRAMEELADIRQSLINLSRKFSESESLD